MYGAAGMTAAGSTGGRLIFTPDPAPATCSALGATSLRAESNTLGSGSPVMRVTAAYVGSCEGGASKIRPRRSLCQRRQVDCWQNDRR